MRSNSNAWSVALCAIAVGGAGGCGNMASSLPGGDSGDPTGTRGPVRVTVLDSASSDAPAAGATVVFVDPDGKVQIATTDANGKASADVLPSASVTSLIARPRDIQAITVLYVAPDEDLVLGASGASSAASGTFTVRWPAAPGAPAGYAVYGPCGPAGTSDGQTLTMAFPIRNDCKPATTEILVCAQDAGGNCTAFDDASEVALAGGSAAMADAWSNGFAFTTTYTHLTGVTSIRSDRHVTDGNGFASGASAATTGTAAATLSVVGPRSTAARMESSLLGPAGGTQLVRQRIAGDAASYQLDVGATALPWLQPPALDEGTQRFRILKLATGTSTDFGDLLELDLRWQRDDGFYTWKVFGPDREAVQLPTLPASLLANLAISAGDDVQASATVYDADGLPGYDAVRSNVAAAIANIFLGARSSVAVVRTSKSSVSVVTAGGW